LPPKGQAVSRGERGFLSRIGYYITFVCRVVMSSAVETSGFCLNLLFVPSQISPLGSASVEMTKRFVERIRKCTVHEWRFLKPYIGLFRNYWRFWVPINEITSKGSSCSLFAARAVSSNSYAASCRFGGFLRTNRLKSRHSVNVPYEIPADLPEISKAFPDFSSVV
jgi:hypothetical protein